jgi:phosphatidylserine/phosphatidylglycerophosphate/cardiolipin synthase-like enzyme
VRLLVWYSPRGSAKQNSLVGYVNPTEFLVGGVINHTSDELRAPTVGMAGSIGRSSVTSLSSKSVVEQRLDYCTRWWREATAGQIRNLEVRGRDGVPQRVKTSVADEADQPQTTAGTLGGLVTEKMLIEENATHHQKPILIDYAYQEGSLAVGYVMGLNSVSDYWDSAEHGFDDPLREQDFAGTSDDVARQALRSGRPVSRKPLQDYAFRVEGHALVDVHQNFCRAWNRAPLLPKLAATSNAKAQAVRSADIDPSLEPRKLGKTGSPAERRLRLQVLRTQPEEGYDDQEKCWAFDKSIKHAYFQATSVARNYIYLENQYFFYEEWARHLKANRTAFMQWVQGAGRTSRDARTLHLMVVMPLPEDEGMIPRTYDTFKSLGQGQSMQNQRDVYASEERTLAAQQAWDARHAALSPQEKASGRSVLGRIGPRPSVLLSPVTQDAQKVKEPTLDKDGVLMQDGKSLGLKVLVCKMATPNRTGQAALGASRDIYIHSKLLMIDDCFMTLGSANLNLRSMSADSEINLATDSIGHVRPFRRRVWGMQTGGEYDGGDGSTQKVSDAFEKWKALSLENKRHIDQGLPEMTGFIVQFEDKRTAMHRYG